MLRVREAVALWVESNGCSSVTPTITLERNARIESYAPCASSAEVRLIVLVDGRHIWPIVTENDSDFLLTDDAADLIDSLSVEPAELSGPLIAWDLFESGIDASETIWEFFSGHTR